MLSRLLQRRAVVVSTARLSHRAISSSRPCAGRLYGQPTHDSHPHLLAKGEVTPGLSAQEYARRRDALMSSLPNDSVVICVAGTVKYATQNIFYKFRQASDFQYLTGIQEPESAVILEKQSQGSGYKMSIFLRARDANAELWDGPRTGIDDAVGLFHADSAYDIKSFSTHVKSAIARYGNVFVDAPKQSSPRRRTVLQYLSLATSSELDSVLGNLSATKVNPLSPRIHAIRRIKSLPEIRLMKQAAGISGSAHSKTMRFTQPGLSEGALAAHFEYLCALKGSERPAYVPVVASGSNALVIHYTANDHTVQDGNLVLMDAGCEYHGYASDITRTWPVSGSFSPAQRDLYQAVLNTLKTVTPFATQFSRQTLHSLHRASCQSLYEELKQIGFSISRRDVDRLYPHFLSHPVGMDLHESGVDQRSEELSEGMVITIEPGIYVPPDPAFPRHFHNIGIRIEDEVLVQKDHVEVLTVNAPKEVVDVEASCTGALESLESPYW